MLPEEPRAFRQVLIQLKLAASGAEADQKLKQGAVKVDGGRSTAESICARRSTWSNGRRAFLLQVGRQIPAARCVSPSDVVY